MLKNIWIGKVFLIVMQTLCSFIVLEIYQIRTCISRSSILNHMDHDRIRAFLLWGGCMQDVSVYICIYSENWKYSINILFGIDTGGCTAYETISYAHWPHSDTFISTHKKQQKYDWTILLLNSSVEILFHQWFQTFQWKIICSFDRNKHSLERMCTWMEMMTKTSYVNFKIKACLNIGGDMNRFHFAFYWIVDHSINISTWIDVSLHPEQSEDWHGWWACWRLCLYLWETDGMMTDRTNWQVFSGVMQQNVCCCHKNF